MNDFDRLLAQRQERADFDREYRRWLRQQQIEGWLIIGFVVVVLLAGLVIAQGVLR